MDRSRRIAGAAAVVVGANFIDASKRSVDPGITTEIAALLLYVVGASIVIGHFAAALVIAGALAALMHSSARFTTSPARWVSVTCGL